MAVSSTTPSQLSARGIFERGSTTYFTASLFFSKALREKVTTVYAFVRVADDFVDATPQDKKGFDSFYAGYQAAWNGKPVASEIINNFVALAQSEDFSQDWIEAFFGAMRADLSKTEYATLEELEEYMFGSAEVIGLMLAKLMRLPPAAAQSAKMLGKAMQYCNFLRDIKEDIALGRTYIPATTLQQFGFSRLSEKSARSKPAQFAALMRSQVKQYDKWMNETTDGFQYIPWRERLAIQTAAKMYTWTARTIATDPFTVFSHKIKPSKALIMLTALKSIIP